LAQKIKVKKDIVYIDGNEVAKIIVEGEEYLFQDLQDTTLAKIGFSGREATSSIVELWVNVADPKGEIVNEVSFRMRGITLSPQKMFASFIYHDLKFFDKEGVKNNVIKEFFSKKTVREDKAKYDKIANEESRILKKLESLSATENGSISNVNRGKEVAKIIAPNVIDVGLNNTTVVKVVDFNGEIIAQIKPIREKYFSISFLNDTSNEQVQFDNEPNYERAQFYEEIIEFLVRKDFYEAIDKGIDKYTEYKRLEFERQTLEAGNFINKRGFIITPKGKRLEGYITLYFKLVVVPNVLIDIEEGFIVGNRVNGKQLSTHFRFVNNESDTGHSGFIHKARDRKKFCIYKDDGSEECYVGVKYKTAGYKFIKQE